MDTITSMTEATLVVNDVTYFGGSLSQHSAGGWVLYFSPLLQQRLRSIDSAVYTDTFAEAQDWWFAHRPEHAP